MRSAPDTTAVEAMESESGLEERLTRPSEPLVDFIRTISGPLVILGAGGKMGPTLAALARQAAHQAGHQLEIIAVSRFHEQNTRHWLETRGVQTLRCDLLEKTALSQLPEAENVLYLVGLKFGTAQNPSLTWAMNTLVPARVCERYPRSRIVALSTGNVYPLSEVSCGGSVETDPLTPLGEYPNAAVARERLFEFHSRQQGTPISLLRLFYAVELRYGVLTDIARKVYANEPIPLANGFFNCIWQGDANEMILRALPLAASPPSLWNLCRPEIFSVREMATRLGPLLGRVPQFISQEAPTALIANSSRLCAALGAPPTSIDEILRWTAGWVKRGGRDLGKPTHFEVRDGNY